MKLLAFDSSSDVLSVGLFDETKKIALAEDPGFARHSSELAPRIERLLRSKKIKLSDLDGIAVGVGPGSFTGLRVGVTAAKVLAFALGKRIAGIPSLEAAARSSGVPDGRIAAHLDARRGRVYAALYEKKNTHFKIVRKPELLMLEDFKKRYSGCGVTIDAASQKPGAEGVAVAALDHFRNGKSVSPQKLEPLYLYPKDCNVTPRKEP